MTLGLRLLLVAAAGFLIAKAHTSAPLLALPCLIPLIVAMQTPDPDGAAGSLKRSIALGALAYLLAGAHVWGIGQYGWTIYGAGVLYLSLAGALFGALAFPFLDARLRLVRVLGLCAAWVLAEYTRTLTPYSYPMLLGPCLGDIPLLSQIAALAGPWGMDGFVALFSALGAEAVEAHAVPRHPRLAPTRPARWLAAALATLTAVALFGALRLSLAGPPGAVDLQGQARDDDAALAHIDRPLRVAMAQGGVPTWLYRRAGVFERLQSVIDANYLGLLDQALDADRPPDWIILPESAFGRTIRAGERGLDQLHGLRDRRLPQGTTLLLGVTAELKGADPEHPAATLENALLAIERAPDPKAPIDDKPAQGMKIRDVATKRLLVPIAEARFRPAPGWRPLDTPQARAGILICYESLYPHIAHALRQAGAEILVVVTTDAGMRWSLAPRVHARLGRLRAIENGVSLLHAGQAGITFAVDPYGRATTEIPLFQRRLATVAVSSTPVWTLYSAVGEGWIAIFALLWALLLALKWRMSASNTPKDKP